MLRYLFYISYSDMYLYILPLAIKKVVLNPKPLGLP